jgi:hypothetical protein
LAEIAAGVLGGATIANHVTASTLSFHVFTSIELATR